MEICVYAKKPEARLPVCDFEAHRLRRLRTKHELKQKGGRDSLGMLLRVPLISPS